MFVRISAEYYQIISCKSNIKIVHMYLLDFKEYRYLAYTSNYIIFNKKYLPMILDV